MKFSFRWRSLGWCGLVVLNAACRPIESADIDIHIENAGAFHDLVATVDPPRAKLSWEVDGAATDFEAVVPAREVRPGQVWTATANVGRFVHSESVEIPPPPGGNVLVLLFDDIGIDHVGAYGVNPAAPPTPTLDRLAEQGVRFDQAYSSPVCSPTRGILLTGRHARRTGLGWIADTGSRDYALPLAALTIPEALDGAWDTYANSAVGKWHMAGPKYEDVLTHPNDQGFDWYAGTVGNPKYRAGYGYDVWDRNENGVVTESDVYLTTATVDDALDRIATMPEPWFLYVAFNAAHTPLTEPPPELITAELTPLSTTQELFDAVVEAMDTEIGRLFDEMGPVLTRTTVIAVGDNGTPDHAVDPPYTEGRAKHTVYEGGVRVPFIVSGPHVAAPGSVSDALVHVADVFSTTLDIAGVPLTGPEDTLAVDLGELVGVDGRSLLPQLKDPTLPGRTHLYVEGFFPNGPTTSWSINRRAVRDEQYKVLRNGDGDPQFFDVSDPSVFEGIELVDEDLDDAMRDARDELIAELESLENSLMFDGF